MFYEILQWSFLTHWISFFKKISTAIHEGQKPEQWESRAVVPPISLSTTFKQAAPAQHHGYEYSRSGNPTRNVLEVCLASLDNAKYGLTFSSGLGAQTALIATLKSGDRILCGDDIYGGTNRLFRNLAMNMGIGVDFVSSLYSYNPFWPNRKFTAFLLLGWLHQSWNIREIAPA